MSFLKSTQTLKEAVLKVAGELTDGTSDYDDDAVMYLNNVEQGLLAGGNEFGVDVAEPWVWAQAKRPIVIKLQPAVTGAAAMVNGSTSGTFSVAPASSLLGRHIRFDSTPDVYRIVEHTAASTAFSIDQAYLDDSGTPNYTAYKLDYDLIDDVIVIDSSNNKLDFHNGTTSKTATITAGVYSPTTLCTEIKTQMEAADAVTYTITFDALTRKFTLAHGSAFSLRFLTGTYVRTSISGVLGFEMEDTAAATSVTSAYALNGILRISKPMTMYREAPAYGQSAKDAGKIFMLDDNTFLREFPLSRIIQQVPDKFCVVSQTPEGLWSVRMNASVVDEEVRVEVNYIPVKRQLVDSDDSFPLVPGSYSDYLIFGAAFFILTDKSDTKAEKYASLAQAKLKSLINDNRKGLSLAGQNYGKLVPRRGQSRTLGFNTRGS